jgi:endoglucanase
MALLVAGPAVAARLTVPSVLPSQLVAGTTLRAAGTVRAAPPGARAVLQQRVGRAWRARASVRLSKTRRFTLRWTAAGKPGATLRLRVTVARRGRVLAASPARTVRLVAPAAPAVPASPPPPAATPPASTAPVQTTSGQPAVSTVVANPWLGRLGWADPLTQAAAAAKAATGADAALLEKIATTPSAVWFGDWLGPDPGAAVAKTVARAHAAGAYPLLVVYDLPSRDCGGHSSGGAPTPAAYKAWIDRFTAALAPPAAVIVEPDALGQLGCISPALAQQTLELVRYAGAALAARGGIAVYLDAGNSAWQSVPVMTQRLLAAGVTGVRGFALNFSNFRWTSDELAYGDALAATTGGHYIVDTGRNGQGPGDGNVCNPPGRGLGARPTTVTGSAWADAFVWGKPPGESDGSCSGGPAPGAFWPQYALSLAALSAW